MADSPSFRSRIQSTLCNSPTSIVSILAEDRGSRSLGSSQAPWTAVPLASGQGATRPQQAVVQLHRIAGQPQVQLAVVGAQPWPFPHGVG